MSIVYKGKSAKDFVNNNGEYVLLNICGSERDIRRFISNMSSCLRSEDGILVSGEDISTTSFQQCFSDEMYYTVNDLMGEKKDYSYLSTYPIDMAMTSGDKEAIVDADTMTFITKRNNDVVNMSNPVIAIHSDTYEEICNEVIEFLTEESVNFPSLQFRFISSFDSVFVDLNAYVNQGIISNGRHTDPWHDEDYELPWKIEYIDDSLIDGIIAKNRNITLRQVEELEMEDYNADFSKEGSEELEKRVVNSVKFLINNPVHSIEYKNPENEVFDAILNEDLNVIDKMVNISISDVYANDMLAPIARYLKSLRYDNAKVPFLDWSETRDSLAVLSSVFDKMDESPDSMCDKFGNHIGHYLMAYHPDSHEAVDFCRLHDIDINKENDTGISPIQYRIMREASVFGKSHFGKLSEDVKFRERLDEIIRYSYSISGESVPEYSNMLDKAYDIYDKDDGNFYPERVSKELNSAVLEAKFERGSDKTSEKIKGKRF